MYPLSLDILILYPLLYIPLSYNFFIFLFIFISIIIACYYNLYFNSLLLLYIF
nr:MAG TPA: hypothetical protein [Caudoviricetes sp.]